MRLIDADELKKWLKSPVGFRANCEDCTSIDCLDCIIEEAIDNANTIEAAPVVHGRWIKDGEVVVCSECGEEHGWTEYRATYCEDCGARMDGDGKATTTPTTGNNYQSCKHCNSTFIGLEEYAECPVCGQPFEEVST